MLVELTRYQTEFEAEMAADRLRQLGIRAAAQSIAGGGYGSQIAFAQGVRVMVHEEDLEEARQTLADIESELGE